MYVSVGIFAHNDGDTISGVVEAFLGQSTVAADIKEIIAVCCGCTDNTVEVIESYARRDCRIGAVEREQRQGKVAAINQFLSVATGEVVVLSGGDIVPHRQLVERLTKPLAANPDCSMTGPHVHSAAVGRPTVAARLHDVLWRLHHQVALRSPKLGETVAVRRSALPSSLPGGVHCDEVLIESLVSDGGGTLTYVPDAHVLNFPPRSVVNLYDQRRRVACQHTSARKVLGYRPSTTRPANVLRALGAAAIESPSIWAPLLGLLALQSAAMLHGRLDHLLGRRYRVWRTVGRQTS